MCVAQTAKRRRKQAKLDPRYRQWTKDASKRDAKLRAQIERQRRIQAGAKGSKAA